MESQNQKTEILVVVSKVKKLIREKSGMNTSSEAIERLSLAIERLVERGIESAKADKRKTVLGRDIMVDHL